MGEGLLMLKVSVVKFFVLDDPCTERLSVAGAIDSKGTQHCGFPGIAGGNSQPFFLCHNDLLDEQIRNMRLAVKPHVHKNLYFLI